MDFSNQELMGNISFFIFIAGTIITLGYMTYDYKKSAKKHEKKN